MSQISKNGLPTVDLPNLIADFSISARPFLVSKEMMLPVRFAVAGEEMQTGERAKQGDVAILDPANENEKPLYCMDKNAFINSSQPALGVGNKDGARITKWFVERGLKEAWLIDESHGPFHLAAPENWSRGKTADEAHPGWDVNHVSEFMSPEGKIYRGYLLVKTKDGIIYDRMATEGGHYKLAPNALG